MSRLGVEAEEPPAREREAVVRGGARAGDSAPVAIVARAVRGPLVVAGGRRGDVRQLSIYAPVSAAELRDGAPLVDVAQVEEPVQPAAGDAARKPPRGPPAVGSVPDRPND